MYMSYQSISVSSLSLSLYLYFAIFSSKMAAMLIIAGQAYLSTDIVLCDYTDAMYDNRNDLYHFRSLETLY